MKTVSHIIFIISLCCCLLFACSSKESNTVEQTADTIPMLVTQIQKCSRLYATEYHIRKIVTHKDEKKLQGSFLKQKFSIPVPVGERRIAIPVEATVKTYIDFKDFKTDDVVRKGEKIEIFLPDPQITITSTKVRHEDVRQYVPMLRSNFSDEELAAYENEGRQAIINDLANIGMMEQARESAANTLIPLIAQTGFKQENITITFRKKFTLEDITGLIGINSSEHETGH